MPIPAEPIGSIPRPPALIEAGQDLAAGRITADAYARLAEQALRETIEQFEATGSPVITDGEQTKPSFATYPVDGLETLAPDGAVIPFADGHTRQLPRLTAGPFRYTSHADRYLSAALRYAHVPVKRAVIAASCLSLLYPQDGIGDYPREAFTADLVREAAADIRGALDKGAWNSAARHWRVPGCAPVAVRPPGRCHRQAVRWGAASPPQCPQGNPVTFSGHSSQGGLPCPPGSGSRPVAGKRGRPGAA